jgi:hypothetical protein
MKDAIGSWTSSSLMPKGETPRAILLKSRQWYSLVMEITITIPEELVSRARSIGVSPENYVERLLGRVAAASSGEGGDGERLRRELESDWDEYCERGLHLDGAEVDAWLARLGDGHFEEPPALHR